MKSIQRRQEFEMYYIHYIEKGSDKVKTIKRRWQSPEQAELAMYLHHPVELERCWAVKA